MKNNKILVTGASSGIGKSLVKYLSKNNYEVIAIARNIKEIESGDNIHKYEVDLSNSDQLELVLSRILQDQGYISNIVNNAGVMIGSEFEKLNFEELEYSFKVNAKAPYQIMKKFLPYMKENNFGRIINLTSGAPLNCFPGYVAYSSSKAALNAISETLANEVNEFDIKVSLMSPGPCKTKMAPNGVMDPSACHSTVQFLLDVEKDIDTKGMFWLGHKIPLKPELKEINWLEGTADEVYKIL